MWWRGTYLQVKQVPINPWWWPELLVVVVCPLPHGGGVGFSFAIRRLEDPVSERA